MTTNRKEAVYRVSVTAKCIGCGSTREIQAGEIPAGEMPMCHCGMPMIATRARASKELRNP